MSSAYREKLVEHLFVSELLKISWLHRNCSIDIAKPEVDNAGYDIIAEDNGFVRHIQLKSSKTGAKAASQKIHVNLAVKPSGCVVWIEFDETTMQLGPFLYLGGEAGKSLEINPKWKTGKHTKGNKEGTKAERPNIRVVPIRDFGNKIVGIEELYNRLFNAPISYKKNQTVTQQIEVKPLVGERKRKFWFNGQLFGSGRLVLAVINRHVESNPTISYEELEQLFPKSCVGRGFGVFETLEIASKQKRKRYFLAADDIVKLSDATIAVCSQWDYRNIGKFIAAANDCGYSIQ
jgi:hypothetical protein